MTVQEAIKTAKIKLEENKIKFPFLEAEIILAYLLGKPRLYLYTYPEKKLTNSITKRYKQLINRRSKGEPTAYLIGEKEFFGLKFFVNKNVLIPRPETELIVEEVINLAQKLTGKITLLDIGTGSGCLAITLAKHLTPPPDVISGCGGLPQISKILATDISQKVLKTAKKNAKIHKVYSKINFFKGDLLRPLKNRINSLEQHLIIMANLPYLTSFQYKKFLPQIKYEPKRAFLGGADGLKYFKKIFDQINRLILNQRINILSLILVLEIDPRQKMKIKNLLLKYLPRAQIKIKKDLASQERVVLIYYPISLLFRSKSCRD